MPPASAHLACRVRNAASTQSTREIFYQTATVVVVEPVFQIMKPRKVLSRALAAAISIEFDVIQKTFRRPVRFRLVEHSGETECGLEECPAIHPLKVYGRRLDAIVDFKREMLVAGSDQSLSHRRCSFSNWQTLPVSCFGFRDESAELVLPFKQRVKRQSRFERERDRAH